MFSGPPLPLARDFPVRRLVALSEGPSVLGAWVRSSARELRLYARAAGRCCQVLVSGDLGLLLGRCREVALREGSLPVVLRVEELIQWRALQVVTGMSYLPGLERLKEIFPGAHLNPAGFHVPIQSRAPEEVLADCLAHGIPVAASRIIYRAPTRPHIS